MLVFPCWLNLQAVLRPYVFRFPMVGLSGYPIVSLSSFLPVFVFCALWFWYDSDITFSSPKLKSFLHSCHDLPTRFSLCVLSGFLVLPWMLVIGWRRNNSLFSPNYLSPLTGAHLPPLCERREFFTYGDDSGGNRPVSPAPTLVCFSLDPSVDFCLSPCLYREKTVPPPHETGRYGLVFTVFL